MEAADHPGQRPGPLFSRYELVNRVRGYECAGYERTIDAHTRNPRSRIETAPHAASSSTPSPAPYRLAATRDRVPASPGWDDHGG